ncbi:hypothetical protein Pst134EA_009643 [Puccinia striiformis f. sp. tritici]|uniref:hypothetical protein n=1 Tax=Puccinia striiformis f. sp. tritici TaxID=168172 RepID=UPI000A127B9B|nr:hypothetical protein Pst134EA_009643 [Puccinia striiformis f. sp. tritici]KAH9458437.1 hypothetical protein Pst134EB_010740 [Puccinia striiformis f. sp. tritici]KAH9469114.1 hypothetical protein Pst134EA_009643 [Puccinia striiformis f. sp. tritici]KAI9611942.1 hypothetical protein H4Q26_008031 [Puccinia striiformis f. sp. tritici PST-130]KAI9620998.1 hypothetical protein KEM48_007931 [Puccinia striiformis f. sp. tritici PST-130]
MKEDFTFRLTQRFDPVVPFLSDDGHLVQLGSDVAKPIITLFRTTINKDLRTTVGGTTVRTPLEMYKLIKLNCKHSDRQHKL